MSAITLRDYQQRGKEAILRAQADGWQRVLATAPTGSGKTVLFASLVSEWLANGLKVLVVVDGTELVSQGYQSIKSLCDLSIYEIATEQGKSTANHATTRVVVGSLDTIVKEGRLSWFAPDVIIVDEADQAASVSHKSIAHRFGVYDGRCFYVGFTATPKRHDKQALFAEDLAGNMVEIEGKSGTRQATFEECVFQKHIFDYPITQALTEGWLVPIKGFTVRTETDLRKVPTTASGDYQAKALAKQVQNAERTLIAIEAYKQHLTDRPTLVFCASVEHAYHAQKLFEEAGFYGEVVDGKTDAMQRQSSLMKFKCGKLPLLFNFGVFCRGTDIPNCSGLIFLRPTQVWSLFCQMLGRGTRPLPGLVSPEMSDAERRWAIESSDKPDLVCIDVVDITDKHDACSIPNILDLPTKLDLEGHSVEEAKRLLDEFKEVREQVIGECPLSYTELKVRLAEVSMVRRSGAGTSQSWAVMEGGYRFLRTQPGYQANLHNLDSGDLRLTVTGPGGVCLLDKTGKAGKEFKAYLDHAAKHAQNAIRSHAEAAKANEPKGTLVKLKTKQINCLKANGHTLRQIDCMTTGYAHKLIKQYVTAWQARKAQEMEQTQEAA